MCRPQTEPAPLAFWWDAAKLTLARPGDADWEVDGRPAWGQRTPANRWPGLTEALRADGQKKGVFRGYVKRAPGPPSAPCSKQAVLWKAKAAAAVAAKPKPAKKAAKKAPVKKIAKKAAPKKPEPKTIQGSKTRSRGAAK